LIRLVALALLSYSRVLAIPTIEAKGSKFFTSDGDQFYIKGVAYQPKSVGTNNLVKGDQCKADAQLIKALGANVVRVYTVDPTLNHDDCMNAFADAGIYVLVDMTTPNFAINRANPAWTLELRNAFAQVVDGFQKYDNLLAFIAGNEVINDASSSAAALYVKASIADMKAYRDLMQYRKIPIGYSAADVTSLRQNTQNYFDCGSSAVAAEFFSYNYYGWCNDSSFTKSGYDQLYNEANGFDVPIFLSETGCINDSRDFSDQVAMLGRQMNDRFSGNIIYEWSEESNGYGLVSYKGDTVSKMGDYTQLSSQWATLTPAGVKESAYNPSLTRRACPSSKASVWEVKGDALPTLG
ncbi:Glucanosyltransferase, partial [Clohesyomyces aquaticus]